MTELDAGLPDGSLHQPSVRWPTRIARGAWHTWLTLVGLVYPRECVACGTPLSSSAPGDLCRECAAGINYIGGDLCPKCGYPFGPYVGERREACPECRPGLFFTRLVSVWRYYGPGGDMIRRWKYRGILSAERLLVSRLADRLEGTDFVDRLQVIVAVPIHWKRRVKRRFNQADMLGRGVARKLDLPFVAGALVRVRDTPSQTGLSRPDRIKNVRGAFRVRHHNAVRGKVVLLVDDVVTTCATVSECSRALRRAGARAVYVASVAR